MDDAAYFASLSRPENARCADHRRHGYGGPFGQECRDCVVAKWQALQFQKRSRAATDAAIDVFAGLEALDLRKGQAAGLEVAA